MPEGKRQPQGGGRFPSLQGSLMVDTVRGSIRVRSWPKKRPGPRHPTNEWWTGWLKAATFLYRYQPAVVQGQLAAATKGTVWMPRDVFISAMRGRAWLLQDEQGRTYHPMAYVKDVSESLDAIGQFPGMMMMRGSELWQPIQPGTPGQLLTYVSDSDPAVWEDPPSIGYHVRRILATSPTGGTIWNVNSTNYQFFPGAAFAWDWDEFPMQQIRLCCGGNSNQAGQTITAQIAQNGSLNTPITAGDDLVINNTPSFQTTGWINVTDPRTDWQEMCVTLKGSNTTVDLVTGFFEVHIRGA